MRKVAVALDLEQRLQLPGLDPRRADLTVAGAVLLDTILRRSVPRRSRCAISRCAKDWCSITSAQHRSDIARVDTIPTSAAARRSSSAERCNWEAAHSQQRRQPRAGAVRPDDRRARHGDREREWLEFASLLHDIGNHISYERHHRHSYYLIKNGDLRGFEPEEIEVIALVARYHRRGTPEDPTTATGLPSGLRRTVRILSAFLRVAETLDRSRNGVVRKVESGNGPARCASTSTRRRHRARSVGGTTAQRALEQAGTQDRIVAHHLKEPDVPARTAEQAAASRGLNPNGRPGHSGDF